MTSVIFPPDTETVTWTVPYGVPTAEPVKLPSLPEEPEEPDFADEPLEPEDEDPADVPLPDRLRESFEPAPEVLGDRLGVEAPDPPVEVAAVFDGSWAPEA